MLNRFFSRDFLKNHDLIFLSKITTFFTLLNKLNSPSLPSSDSILIFDKWTSHDLTRLELITLWWTSMDHSRYSRCCWHKRLHSFQVNHVQRHIGHWVGSPNLENENYSLAHVWLYFQVTYELSWGNGNILDFPPSHQQIVPNCWGLPCMHLEGIVRSREDTVTLVMECDRSAKNKNEW